MLFGFGSFMRYCALALAFSFRKDLYALIRSARMEIWVSLTLVVTCGLTYYRNRKSCKSLSYYYQNNIIVGTPCDEEVTVPPFTTLERHDGGEGNS